MSLSAIQGLNPLYRDHPDVFWTLFDSAKPCVEDILLHHQISRAEAVRFFALWEATQKDNSK